jgi:hypothetical protein
MVGFNADGHSTGLETFLLSARNRHHERNNTEDQHHQSNPEQGFHRAPDNLPDLNPEKHGIGVFMAPVEVVCLLIAPHSMESSIVPVLLAEVNAVSTIFLAVPLMVIAVFAIVVAPFMMLVGVHCHRGDQGGAQQEPTEN